MYISVDLINTNSYSRFGEAIISTLVLIKKTSILNKIKKKKVVIDKG